MRRVLDPRLAGRRVGSFWARQVLLLGFLRGSGVSGRPAAASPPVAHKEFCHRGHGSHLAARCRAQLVGDFVDLGDLGEGAMLGF